MTAAKYCFQIRQLYKPSAATSVPPVTYRAERRRIQHLPMKRDIHNVCVCVRACAQINAVHNSKLTSRYFCCQGTRKTRWLHTQRFHKHFCLVHSTRIAHAESVQGVERSIVCTPLSVKVLVTLPLSNIWDIIWNTLHYQWNSHWTVAIPSETRCVLLHYDSSKHCTYPLNIFI
jgi:hypothetical protein